jgi:3-hydroxyacyl-[acyl-carrier-protein] dehydratase
MRWFWIDKFIDFERGKRATAIKNVSLAEEHLHHHFTGYPVMPHPLVVEGLAQTGGLLVGEYNAFRERVVLAKISKAVFTGYPVPGDTLTYSVEVDDIKPDGAFVTGTSRIGERPHGEFELVFAYLDRGEFEREQFEPADFATLLRMLGVYDVGHDSDGNPLEMPKHLHHAELVAQAKAAPGPA